MSLKLPGNIAGSILKLLDNTMKVVQVLHELKFSGAEIMYVDASPYFREKGCKLSVLATAPNLGEYSRYFEEAGYQVLHKPYPRGWNFASRISYWIWFIRLLTREKYDVVHIHSHAIMWGMSLCAWIAGKRSVYTFHSVFTSHFYSYPYHLWQRWSAKKIFGCRFQSISHTVYEHELEHYHNKTWKIYNWYGYTRFFPAMNGEKKRNREELGIPTDALVIISIGGCSFIKRHEDIIKALPLIAKQYPSVQYLHLGKGETEEAEKRLAAELGVDKNIRFCGNQTDIRKYLVASDIYVMTSRHEGISITTIEAMACGIPSILYNVAGLRDFNMTGENSLLIPEEYGVLAEKIIYLHQHSEVSAQLAARAKSMVNSTYHLKKNAEEIYQLYS
jgi:glycosyltransferase involved in cell wall biosynthesis